LIADGIAYLPTEVRVLTLLPYLRLSTISSVQPWLTATRGASSCSFLAQVPQIYSSTVIPVSAVDQGSNLQALIDALNTPALPNARIVLVFSNRKAAYGLTRAQQASPPISTAYLALQPYLKANSGKTREDYDAEVAKTVVKAKPDIVVLAGWMHIMSEAFLDILAGDRPYEADSRVEKPIPVINLHPALPGAFDGAHAIERAYEAFQKGEIKHSGAMVHRVVREVDRGEPIIVREVEIKEGEPIETFEERLHRVEWEIIVEGTAKVLNEVKPSSGMWPWF
jgi:phosphoribosylglycinamide formyltransferase